VELTEVLRTTGAVREFTDETVSDEQVQRVLDAARFAPSGGNRQGWRVIQVQDTALRRRLRDLYLDGWYQYLALGAAGLIPWSPLGDRDAEGAAVANAGTIAAQAAAGPGGFAEHLDQVPVLLLVLADLHTLAAVDRDLGRFPLVGGASIYPFVWNIVLAARDAGLGGVITTILTRQEPAVRELLGIPDHYVLAAAVALGHPQHQPTRLRRQEVGTFTTVDRFDGPSLGGTPAG
jgi:nitroreductase